MTFPQNRLHNLVHGVTKRNRAVRKKYGSARKHAENDGIQGWRNLSTLGQSPQNRFGEGIKENEFGRKGPKRKSSRQKRIPSLNSQVFDEALIREKQKYESAPCPVMF
jgi:hypothetical protein